MFLVTWVSSVIGAVMVYYLSRTYGRGFFKGRLGRVLSSPEAIATMEREYLRFGLAGIVIGRLLPGVRSFVAPFTGLIGLSPARAILPMAVASGIWYAGIVVLATFVGSEWDRIGGTIERLNRGLGLFTAVLVLGAVAFILIRIRRSRRRRFWDVISDALGRPVEVEGAHDQVTGMAAAATLMLELARADETLTPEELETVAGYLRHRWGLPPAADGEKDRPILERARLLEYANRVSRDYRKPEREALMQRLWRAVLGDQVLEERELRLMRRAGMLLGLSEEEIELARYPDGPPPADGP